MFPVLFSLCFVGITHVALADNVCPRPPEVPLATVNVNKEAYRPGESIVYQCNPGYTPQSVSRRYICTSLGIWPTVTFRCIPKKCPYSGPLDNGAIHITDLNYLSVVNFTCDTGFYLEGPISSQCQADGSWSESLPECLPVICPPPPVSGALSYHKIGPGDSFIFYDMVTFSCPPHFMLFGTGKATCQADGTWTDIPVCKYVECPPPQPIENGFINFDIHHTYYYQDIVIYGCNLPYTMDGVAESRCDETGTWSSKPACRAPCDIAPKKATVFYNGQKMKVKELEIIPHGDTIWFFCKSKTQKCSYKTATQCIDGQLSIPDCYEEHNWFISWFKKDPADMPPCEN